MTAEAKAQELSCLLRALGWAAVAFSGGVDSSFLLAAAVEALGAERVLALTADSPLLPRRELQRASQVAAELGVRHQVILFDELCIPEVAENHPRRCYFCKKARFTALQELLRAHPGMVLLHGENADDAADYRPGSEAARELGVRAPLAEVGLTKAEIRFLSRRRGLSTADLPAAACLATRFPYDTRLTLEGLARVERAEEALHDVLGPIQVRVRDHFPMARIEVPPAEIMRVAAEGRRGLIVGALRALGYLYVTLDLAGYRMGAMNEPLEPKSG
ncbi:MAG: ATP-dependent sacrificial sulfur transferase LarE [Chloroflexi bacterium]|nr:ATP-dependent sacrificial sulfur transferase LarE [Chloroflexota bacterium]